jgi:hypothetical protein
MNTENEIENWLRKTPPPTPPADLLAALEREIEVPAAPLATISSEPVGATLRHWWRRLWLPVTGLGTATAALILGLVVFSSGSGRSIAAAGENLKRVKSVRVVKYERSGPAQHVFRDRSKPVNAWPNFSTTAHPDNPLLATEIWFRAGTSHAGNGEMVTLRATETIWNRDNWELRVDHATGDRRLRLNSQPLDINRLASPVLALGGRSFQPAAGVDATHAGPELDVSNCWVGEHRYAGIKVGKKRPNMLTRLWLDETALLARRIEWISDDYTANAEPWITQAYEFYDFDQPLPDELFAFEITEADAAGLGLSLTELQALSVKAFSAELTGEMGIEFEGTIQDSLGSRKIAGRLPFIFVHDPVGPTSIEMRFKDGQRHSVGINVNSLQMATWASGLQAEVSVEGLVGAQSVD